MLFIGLEHITCIIRRHQIVATIKEEEFFFLFLFWPDRFAHRARLVTMLCVCDLNSIAQQRATKRLGKRRERRGARVLVSERVCKERTFDDGLVGHCLPSSLHTFVPPCGLTFQRDILGESNIRIYPEHYLNENNAVELI